MKNNKHDVEVLLFDNDPDVGFVYHCARCGKVANGEAGARRLDKEICIGKKVVQ